MGRGIEGMGKELKRVGGREKGWLKKQKDETKVEQADKGVLHVEGAGANRIEKG